MPEMDGYEVAKRLRQTKRHQETPIVALSANVTRSVVGSIKEVGMNAYIEKPINMNKFMSVLSNLFELQNIENQNIENQETSNLVFDRKQIEKIMDYDKDNIIQLLEIFLNTHEQANQTIKSMIEQKQIKEVLSELHKLKGVSANLYLSGLVRACDELKTAIENKTEITNNLEHFNQIFSFTIKEINAYMEDITKVKEEDNDVQCTIG
jgi:CheY-like chemotaxis protein